MSEQNRIMITKFNLLQVRICTYSYSGCQISANQITGIKPTYNSHYTQLDHRSIARLSLFSLAPSQTCVIM